MSECTDVRHELGAYVLGGLDEADAGAVEAHLRDCDVCRSERAELAVLTDLLDLARDVPPHVPARVRDRVVAQAARRQGHRRWLAMAAAASLAAALLGGFVGWRLAPPPPPAVAVPLEGTEPFEASGWVAYEIRDGHTIVVIDLDDLEPLSEPAVYEAWLSSYDGRIQSIGQLGTAPDGTIAAALAVDGPLEGYRGFWVTAEPDGRDPAHAGPTVVAGPVPPLP